MQRSADLTTVEQQVLMAIIRLRPNAYGVSIRDEIEMRTSHAPSIGAIYAALERLQSKGFLSAREGEPTAQRGGRSKLFFDLTAKGRTSLSHSLAALDALRPGAGFVGATA